MVSLHHDVVFRSIVSDYIILITQSADIANRPMFTKLKSSILTNRIQIDQIYLVANALVWYSAITVILQESQINSQIWVIHYLSLIFSALLGAWASKRIGKNALMIWSAVGAISSLGLFQLESSSFIIAGGVAISLGCSLGLGMPAIMNFYSHSIPVEERGRAGGLTLLIVGAGLFAILFFPVDDLLLFGLILFLWRISSFYFLKKLPVAPNNVKNPSFIEVGTQRSFLLYFVPWFMFSLVNYLTEPLNPYYGVDSGGLELIRTVLIGVSAVAGGFLADIVGRKRVAIAGFVMLGIGYAGLGIGVNSISVFFDAIFNGVAWGLLLVLFILTVWGDLSFSQSSSKYYALGVAPFFISIIFKTVLGEQLFSLDNEALFPFAAFFLFLAILPLVYAPETLPEKKIKERELEAYIQKAQKIKDKLE